MKRRKLDESTLNWVAGWLAKEGYVLASCIGRVCTKTELAKSDSIGLLIPRQGDSELRRRSFVGVLWFNNRTRGANSKEWVFEVYGKEYFESFQALARKLWSTFYVSIEVRFIKDHPETEIFLSDLDLLCKGEMPPPTLKEGVN